jgi:transposase
MTTDAYMALLRRLMADDVSLERAHRELNAFHFRDHASAATVEALMYLLRERGTAALKEPQTRRRLGALSEAQLHEVATRLQRLKITRAWIADDVKQLIEAWETLRHG